MARGFNVTLGGSSSDLITSSLATNSVLRSYWMHFYRRPGGTQIFWRQDNGTNVNQCYTDGTSFIFHRHWTGGLATWVISAGTTNAWHTFGWSYDGGSTSNVPVAYMDGATPAVVTQTGASGSLIDLTGAPFYIGNYSGLTFCVDGMIAEFAIWDAILTDAEFFAMDKGYSPLFIRPDKLVEYLPFVRDGNSRKFAATTVSGTAVQPHPRTIRPRGFNRTTRLGTSVVVALDYLRPDTDDSISDWTDQAGGTTNIYTAIDETAFDDADYIKSPTPPAGSVARFRMANPTAGLGEPVKVRYRYKKTAGSNQLVVSLKQGTTLIKSWMHPTLTTSFQTATQTLSSGEFAAITDFNNLFLEFQASTDLAFGMVNTHTELKSTSAASVSFPTAGLGTATADRQIFVAVSAVRTDVGTLTTVSVTLDGNSMTSVIEDVNNTFYGGIFRLAYPSGSTGNITVTYNTAMAHNLIGVYAVTGGASAVKDTDFNHDLLTTINVAFDSAATYGVAGYGILFAGMDAFSGNIASATNLTLDYNNIITAGTAGGAVGSNLGPLTSATTVTINKSSGTYGSHAFAVIGM